MVFDLEQGDKYSQDEIDRLRVRCGDLLSEVRRLNQLKAEIPSLEQVVSEVWKRVEVYNQESVQETYAVICEALGISAV